MPSNVALTKKPKGVIVIEGFPGFGLVATIATGFLVDHLKCELIGRHFFEDSPATIAIHAGKTVEPIGVYYNKDYNIIVLHAITAPQGLEWKITDLILDLCKQLQAKELISLEGIGTTDQTAEDKGGAFFHCNDSKCAAKLKAIGAEPLQEGIIVGVTGALLMKAQNFVPLTCIFAEAHTNLPDSKAAAKIIEVLDKYLGLRVDYKPLLKQAEQFEMKLKSIIQQSMTAKEQTERKQLSYVG